MKVAVVVVVYNLSAEIFLLQMAAIKKFCTDKDYVIHVFDNSSDPEKAEHIRYHAEQNGIDYCKIFATSNNSSDSHSWAANFAYQKLKDNYNYWFFMDHDLIPVKEYSVLDILGGGHVMAGLGQGALKTYMWQGCVMLHLEGQEKNIVDFSCNSEFGLDTGGNLYKVVESFGKESCIFFNESYHQNPYFVSNEYSSYAMIKDETFMHFVGASNWFGKDRHEERINSLINVAKQKTGL